MTPTATVICVLIVLNIPLFILFGKLFFDDWDGFADAVKYWLTPDIISMFRGEGYEDWTSELKIFGWAIACGAAVYGEYWLISEQNWFGL